MLRLLQYGTGHKTPGDTGIIFPSPECSSLLYIGSHDREAASSLTRCWHTGDFAGAWQEAHDTGETQHLGDDVVRQGTLYTPWDELAQSIAVAQVPSRPIAPGVQSTVLADRSCAAICRHANHADVAQDHTSKLQLHHFLYNYFFQPFNDPLP